MRIKLEVLSGPLDGHVFQFNHSVEVGREAKVQIATDNFISRRHALIDLQDPHVYLEDLRSTNGTFVDGERLNGRCELANGKVFKCGRTWLEISW
ncbi:FHA domain-containing protein [bacterium CPR1]|nr:FHA domain-containing protein [bacterium CPR1]